MSSILQAPQNQVSRRTALRGASATTLAALAAPAVAQSGSRVIRMVTSWPADLGGLGASAKRVADGITAASQGRLTVEFYPAGALVPPLEVHDAVGAGDAEMYHSNDYYFQSKHRGFNFFTSVPMGLTSGELIAWLRHAGGQELWDELNAPHNIKALPVGGTSTQMGGWFNKELTSIEDFKGLTMRMPGLGGQVISRLGAKAVVLPGGDIVNALFDGTIDAAEWVGPYNDLHFGFQKLLSNYVYPGFHEPGNVASLGMNLGFWESLPPADRALIRAVIDAELTHHMADYYGNNGLALIQLLREFGVQPRRMPEDIWNELARVSLEVSESVAEDDALGRRIYESYSAYRNIVGSAALISQEEFLARRGAEDLFASI